MAQDLLFEIGAEEIPASYIQPALDQMKSLAEAYFHEQRLAHEGVRSEGTPRRLVLMVKGLQDRQDDKSEEVQGPSAKAAFGPDGQLTQVGLGFAKGKGIDPAKLTLKSTPKGDYVVGKVFMPGRFAAELLEDWLPKLVKQLAFPKSMRWAEGGPLKFARPISWLCALYGDRVLKFELDASLKSGNVTFGHRFLAPKAITLKSTADYEKKLEGADVVLSFAERVKQLKAQLEKAAKKHGSLAQDDALVNTVANLLEKPFVLAGEFSPAYLVLPKGMIITVLREHQFCFAVETADGKLAPIFLATTNGIEKNLNEIREGNARVIRARLEDAKFFYTEDQKISLEQRREELKSVVWQEKLGTVLERVERIEKLAASFAAKLAPGAKDAAARAGRLCKSDLQTLVVGEKEFTSLQGEMGGIYARLAGEPEAVAAAIAEHYKPRFAGDTVPGSDAGKLVALADKLDDLVGCFGIGMIPSSSQDPYALRRKASGIVAILRASEAEFSLREALGEAIQAYPAGRLSTHPHELVAQILDFFRARLENALADEGIEAGIVEAVAATRGEFIREAFVRAAALQKLVGRDDFELATTAFSRVTNILAKVGEVKPVKAELLADGAEKILYERYLALRPVVERACAAGDYAKAFDSLAGLRSAIDAYFNDVMVMVDDPALKTNRLSFLAQVASTIALIADFRKLTKR
jgi:glycyl-tRNA synthetase beta chain